MSTFIELFRTAFPRKLRFDQASQIFYAECYTLSRRNRHTKYIRKTDIQDILGHYTPLPGAPWLQLPVIRHVLLIRPINAVRRYCGRRSWLYTRGVQEEYNKLSTWLEEQGPSVGSKEERRSSLATSTPPGKGQGRLRLVVERERFDREVLGNMRVATMYQRMMRIGIVTIAGLIILLFASLNTDWFVYMYCRFWCHMDRAALLEWFRGITEQHTIVEVPPAYRKLLPPPCVRYTDAQGSASYAMNITELTCEEKNITIISIPCPQMGEREFFSKIGELAQVCDSVLLEGVTFDKIDKIGPASFLPLKENTFPALGVHHRYLDILKSDMEPPMLYPAGADVSWNAYLQQILIPFEVRCVYNPTKLSATKGEARIGWGHLRDLIDSMAAGMALEPVRPPPHVICVPWTVNQILNLEASLVKYGFKAGKVFPVHWLTVDHLGTHFCNYYDVS